MRKQTLLRYILLLIKSMKMKNCVCIIGYNSILHTNYCVMWSDSVCQQNLLTKICQDYSTALHKGQELACSQQNLKTQGFAHRHWQHSSVNKFVNRIRGQSFRERYKLARPDNMVKW